MYKSIIFDLDGTLLNTIEDITDSINYALIKNGFSSLLQEEVMYMVGSGVNVLIERALEKFDYTSDDFKKVYNDYMSEYLIRQKLKTRPYDGVIDVLKKIKERGICLGVVSNKPHSDTMKVVTNYFGTDIFDLIYGKREGFLPKPDPSSVNEMIELFNNNKDEVLYIGDSDVDMKTAINCKIDAVAVLWGFRTEEELKKYNPKFMIKNPNQILDIIDERK